MIENVDDLAPQEVEALGQSGELLSRDDPGGKPACNVEHAERGDERRQTEADGEKALTTPAAVPATSPIEIAASGS